MTVIDELQLRMLLTNRGTTSNVYANNSHPLRLFNKTRFGRPLFNESWVDRMITLFNHITEDQVDQTMLAADGGQPLIDAYEWYRESMSSSRRLDFALLLDLLLTEMNGGALTSVVDDIDYVMVDEYQDTNPIQEDIFFALASNSNLCVVGDDDQALYRFRGASVECMVSFPSECAARWSGISPMIINLVENFRSHPRIIDYYETYMNSHPTINTAGNRLRVGGRPPLIPRVPPLAGHPSVLLCQGANQVEADDNLAQTIIDLHGHGVVEDWQQVAILSPSVNEASASGVGYLVGLLVDAGVPVYNPRGKDMSETDEVKALFGVIGLVLDPRGDYATNLHASFDSDLINWIDESRAVARDLARTDPTVATYVADSITAIAAAADDTSYQLLNIMFHVLNLKAFVDWASDPASAWRLAQASNWLEGYSLTPSPKSDNPAYQNVFVQTGEVALHQQNGFYKLACKTIVEGRTVEHEEEDEVVVPGHVSVMTFHQAKGLEFDIVIVRGLQARDSPHSRQPAVYHNYFAPMRGRPIAVTQTVPQLRDFDAFRAYYVSFSRPKHALVLHDPDVWGGVPHHRGHINHDQADTRTYVTGNPDTAVIR
jgi:DNA helicase-2/ATP-dependent DNA helicase PcrA